MAQSGSRQTLLVWRPEGSPAWAVACHYEKWHQHLLRSLKTWPWGPGKKLIPKKDGARWTASGRAQTNEAFFLSKKKTLAECRMEAVGSMKRSACCMMETPPTSLPPLLLCEPTATINLCLSQLTFGRLATRRCLCFLSDSLHPSHLIARPLCLQRRRSCPKSCRVEGDTDHTHWGCLKLVLAGRALFAAKFVSMSLADYLDNWISK